MHACFCIYGTGDPRCCVNRSMVTHIPWGRDRTTLHIPWSPNDDNPYRPLPNDNPYRPPNDDNPHRPLPNDNPDGWPSPTRDDNDLRRRQREHLDRVRKRGRRKHIPCAHDSCPKCIGTGVDEHGRQCIHYISCPCPKCTPWC